VRPGVAETFAKDGGTACASAAELAAASDVVVSVVVNAAQTEDVLFGSGGGRRRAEARQRLRDVLDGRPELEHRASKPGSRPWACCTWTRRSPAVPPRPPAAR
jgi:hypothetical protein